MYNNYSEQAKQLHPPQYRSLITLMPRARPLSRLILDSQSLCSFNFSNKFKLSVAAISAASALCPNHHSGRVHLRGLYSAPPNPIEQSALGGPLCGTFGIACLPPLSSIMAASTRPDMMANYSIIYRPCLRCSLCLSYPKLCCWDRVQVCERTANLRFANCSPNSNYKLIDCWP